MLISHLCGVIVLCDGSRSPEDLIAKMSKRLGIIKLPSFFLLLPQTHRIYILRYNKKQHLTLLFSFAGKLEDVP